MRILHVIADLDPRKGGPTSACLGLAKLMARRGNRVTIVATDRGAEGPPRDLPDGLGIELLPASWPDALAASWPMRRRLRELVPAVDIVHLHSLYLFHDWAAGGYCRQFGKPYIVRPHGSLDPYIYRRHRWKKRVLEALFQNAVLRRAAGLHYTTHEEAVLARPFACNDRGAVVPIGIDLDAYEHLPPPAALRQRYPAIGERKIVLFLGRLAEKKGIDIVIQSFAAVARERSDIFLLIAGPDDGIRAQAEGWTADAGIADRCLFTGMVSGEDKRRVLGGSAIFLLPSMSENFGISVIEAAACGLPVVISDRVNLATVFQQAGAGLVAPPAAAPFINHLRYLLDHPDEARRIGAIGADLVRNRFGWNALGEQYESMYATAIRAHALPVLA